MTLCGIVAAVLAPPEVKVAALFLVLCVVPGIVIVSFTCPQKELTDHIILALLTGIGFQIVYAYIISLAFHFSWVTLLLPSILFALLFDVKGTWNFNIDRKAWLIFVPAVLFGILTYNLVPGEDANFSGATFQNANFSGAIFQYADFGEAIFQYADFGEAIFQNAYFSRATFQNAYFSRATFQGTANFSRATFQGTANFNGATFQNADFREATFQNAYFWEATFQNVNFWEATFEGNGLFSRATFQGTANFSRATF